MQAESTSSNLTQGFKFLGSLLAVCAGVIGVNWLLGLVMPMGTALAIELLLLAVFLILLVLVQRGRGGGLAGALGGAGGSSAFGAKAGDNFTWFTIYTATAWIVLCVVAAFWARNREDILDANPGRNSVPLSSTADIDAEPATTDERATTGDPTAAGDADTDGDAATGEGAAADAPGGGAPDETPSEG